jgi:malate/lactate dehydrogenase
MMFTGKSMSVRYANIAIIEGNGASQFGIGIVAARIAEMVLRGERAVIQSVVTTTGSASRCHFRYCRTRWRVADF